MSSVQKIGGIAAFINAAVAAAMLVVAFGLIGLTALIDNKKLIALAVINPTPLVIQDVLKFVSACTAAVLILALFDRLKSYAPGPMRVATLCGFLAVLCLVINSSLSLFSISQATHHHFISYAMINQITVAISLFGMGVIFLNGVWYLLINWSALRHDKLPRPLTYLGLGMGLLSLLPPLSILVLLLSVVWSLWLGQVLLKKGSGG